MNDYSGVHFCIAVFGEKALFGRRTRYFGCSTWSGHAGGERITIPQCRQGWQVGGLCLRRGDFLRPAPGFRSMPAFCFPRCRHELMPFRPPAACVFACAQHVAALLRQHVARAVARRVIMITSPPPAASTQPTFLFFFFLLSSTRSCRSSIVFITIHAAATWLSAARASLPPGCASACFSRQGQVAAHPDMTKQQADPDPTQLLDS